MNNTTASNNSEELDKQYYADLLSGCDTDSTLYPDSVSENEKHGIAEHTCTADFEEVLKFCKKYNVSANAFFNAVFSFVLAKYTNSTEVLYAAVSNDTNDSGISKTRVLPILYRIQDTESFVQLTGDIQTQLLNGTAHDSYSLAEAVRDHDLNINAHFIYQTESFNSSESALQVYLSVTNKKLQLLGKFKTNTYSEFLIRSFLTSFDAAVKECLNVNSLSEISLITPEAARTL
ncbi:MAG TPA: condensation domain-containing protein, partial [Methanocorpusculum sp.]|nr:condensation domain-containing protein [Methanocorpusculum sp.]